MQLQLILWVSAVTLLSVSPRISAQNLICPGAPLTSYGNGTLDCSELVCLGSESRAYPSPDPKKYTVCTGPNAKVEMPCGAGTCFNVQSMACDHPFNWVDACERTCHELCDQRAQAV